MAILLKTKSLKYKDVNLVAQPGLIESRKEIPIEGWRIVISAMSSIIGPSFLESVSNLEEKYRPTLHIPRDIFQFENLDLAYQYDLQETCFVGIGLNFDINDVKNKIDRGFLNYFIDIANGYLPQIERVVKKLLELGVEEIACGSVHTRNGYDMLADAGVTIVRSGISSGSACITSNSTGFTRGSFTEIIDLSASRDLRNTHAPLILADGGFKVPGDCVKAFLGGADYIMSGSLFTDCYECRMYTDGYKSLKIPVGTYFGMASKYGKMCMGKDIEFIEGEGSITCIPNVTLEQRLKTIWEGILSGVSYSGYKTLDAAIGNGIFEIVE